MNFDSERKGADSRDAPDRRSVLRGPLYLLCSLSLVSHSPTNTPRLVFFKLGYGTASTVRPVLDRKQCQTDKITTT